MPLEFGLDFFPDLRPSEKSGQQYFAETLRIAKAGEELGSTRIKIVEHYFQAYGGYSPNPIVYLSAAAAVTKKQRLMTGAVLPIFNHPLKLAGELAMLDCISDGRLDAGIARAFLPHEFEAFGVSMDESRPRFEEGIEALKLLWTQDNVTFHGQFHSFDNVTSLPKPVQQPHPPIWIAAVATPASFVWAGEQGYYLMVVPYVGDHHETAEHINAYRDAYRQSGAPGEPRVMVVLHCVINENRQLAHDVAWNGMAHYLSVFKEAASWWANRDEPQYQRYNTFPALLDSMTRDKVEGENRAIVGDSAEALDKMQFFVDTFGQIEMSFQAHFGGISADQAIESMKLFAENVNPRLNVPRVSLAGAR